MPRLELPRPPPPSALTVNRSPGYPFLTGNRERRGVEMAAPGQMHGEGVVTGTLVPSQPVRKTAELQACPFWVSQHLLGDARCWECRCQSQGQRH